MNPYGPMTAEQFQEAVDAPYGMAASILRRFDPLWGKTSKDGEPVKWKVTLHQQTTSRAYAYVEAVTAEEAELLADQIDDSKLDWDHIDADTAEVVDVVPA